ncbi:MAG: hypothetical protein H5U37_01485, partial [Caldisericia bacterium]|nr:hypothetical protein [Caldisericia bacterium]
MKKLILFYMVLIFSLSFTISNLKFTYSSEKNQIINFHDIVIEVQDENGNLINDPLIYAYSLDYGIMYPNNNQNITLTNQGKITISEGKWEFIAGKQGEEKGYFLVKKVYINQSQTIILRPDSEIGFKFNQENVEFDRFNVIMVEQNLIPLCSPLDVIYFYKNDLSDIRILTNKEFKYSLIIKLFFDNLNETFLILKQNILPNRTIEISINKNDYALINIKAYDNNMSSAVFSFPVYNSCFYNWVTTLYGNGFRNFYITPGDWAFIPKIYVENKIYSFSQETVKLDKNTILSFSYGGKLEPKLKVLLTDDILCQGLKGKTQIFIETKDSFGNLLMSYTGFLNTKVPLKLFQKNKLIYEMDLAEYDPYITLYGNIIDKELDINNSPDYQIDLDLGAFGLFKLTGKLFSDETKLQYESISTENFILNFPKDYKDKFIIYGEFIEKLSKAFSQILGIKINRKTTINFFFGNLTGVSTKGRFDAGVAEIFNAPINQISGGTILITLHEHAHSFQFEFDEPYWVNELFGEQICDYTASFVYEYLWGHYAKLWKLGGIQPFLYKAFEYIKDPKSHPLNLNDPYDLQSAGNMRFILRNLEIKYGEDIHKKFIECWSIKNSPNYIPKSIFDGFNMNDYEKICSIYSYIVGENLGNLFSNMGFNVNISKIDQFL